MAKIYSLNVKDGRVQSVVTQLLWLSILVFYVCMPPGHQPLQKINSTMENLHLDYIYKPYCYILMSISILHQNMSYYVRFATQ